MRTYKTAGQMERGIESMAERGYQMVSQSGELGRTLFVPVWKRKKVVVTFQQTNSPAAG